MVRESRQGRKLATSGMRLKIVSVIGTNFLSQKSYGKGLDLLYDSHMTLQVFLVLIALALPRVNLFSTYAVC